MENGKCRMMEVAPCATPQFYTLHFTFYISRAAGFVVAPQAQSPTASRRQALLHRSTPPASAPTGGG